MLAIRLSRVGKKNFPFFRVVVMDKRKSAKGRALEVLGSVNPQNKEIVLKTERIQYWLGVGAEASNRVYNILVSKKIIEGKKHPKKIRAKKKEEKEGESVTATPAADKPEIAEEPKKETEETVTAEPIKEAKTEKKTEENTEKETDDSQPTTDDKGKNTAPEKNEVKGKNKEKKEKPEDKN